MKFSCEKALLQNAILTACGADGTTTISNAAREPEIADLQLFLQKAGVRHPLRHPGRCHRGRFHGPLRPSLR